MSKIAILNQPIADLSFVTDKTSIGSFAHLRGKNLVLYFYPKDNTSGCTLESKEFRDLYPKFLAANTQILGVSRDSLKSHENFICKYELPFELISDSDETLCYYFDVLKTKSMYGKKYIGIERSTFFIDNKGILQNEWRNIKAPGHAAAVLTYCQEYIYCDI